MYVSNLWVCVCVCVATLLSVFCLCGHSPSQMLTDGIVSRAWNGSAWRGRAHNRRPPPIRMRLEECGNSKASACNVNTPRSYVMRGCMMCMCTLYTYASKYEMTGKCLIELRILRDNKTNCLICEWCSLTMQKPNYVLLLERAAVVGTHSWNIIWHTNGSCTHSEILVPRFNARPAADNGWYWEPTRNIQRFLWCNH